MAPLLQSIHCRCLVLFGLVKPDSLCFGFFSPRSLLNNKVCLPDIPKTSSSRGSQIVCGDMEILGVELSKTYTYLSYLSINSFLAYI